MENPFDSGHIKNYMLLYASIVVIMILFFVASTLFMDVKKVDKKVFNTEVNSSLKIGVDSLDPSDDTSEKPTQSKFKLMEKTY